MNSEKPSISYKDSGVDIDAGNELVERIKSHVASTDRPGVLGGIGGFGGLFELPVGKFKNPVLVSGTDGVGTKLKLAVDMNRHDTIGIDLVAMCVNDIVVTGAEPLFFLDYFATSKLNVMQTEQVIKGIAEGCRQAGCALNGGETAEMPGLYQPNEYDLAGFSVGIVEKSDMITSERVEEGHAILGLASSGPHSNGFSLIRKIVQHSDQDINSDFGDSTLGEVLLRPTRIYVNSILELTRAVRVSGICHITGGGIPENLPRVLPQGLQANLQRNAWNVPDIFNWLQSQGNVEQHEMLRTFNCGIGMIVCLPEESLATAKNILSEMGETVYELGTISQKSGSDIVVWH